jgi:hypothetical protein
MQKNSVVLHSLSRYRRHLIWLAAIFFTLIALVLYLLGDDEITRVSGSAVALIVCALMFAFFSDEKFDIFSPAFFWGINFALFYGVAAILPFVMPPEHGSYDNVFTLGRSYYPMAAIASLFSTLFFFAGYQNKWAMHKGRHVTWFFGRAAPEKNARVFWAILMAMGVSAFLILIAGGGFNQVTTEVKSPIFYSAAGYLQSALFISVPFSVAHALQKRSQRFWKIAAIISVGTTLFFGLPSGSKTLALLSLIFVGFSWNYIRHRYTRQQALSTVLLVLGLLLILTPFNSVYRSLLLDNPNQAEQGLASNFTLMKDAVIELGKRDPVELVDLAVGYTSQRLSNIAIVAIILRRQQSDMELALGDTYARLIYAFIPRFLMPEKPPLTFGRETAVKLKLTDSDGRVLGVEMSNTSVGLTFIGEPIYNFSIYIAPIFMMMLGMFYRWLYEAIGAQLPNSGALAVSLACFVWYSLVFTAHETELTPLFAGVLKFGVFLWLLLRYLNFKKRYL